MSSRPLQLGHMMYSREQWGVIRGEDKYVVTTATGEVEMDPRRRHLKRASMRGSRERCPEATGWPVLRGWRVSFRGLDGPLKLRFQQPVTRATVIDPEALRERRANLAWGERPARTPGDVAMLELSEDGRTLGIVPGPEATGVVFVATNTQTNALRSGCVGRGDAVLVAGEQQVCGATIRLRAGPYVDQPYVEVEDASDRDEASIETLKMLGYLD